MTPFVGAHNMFSVGYRGRAVKALLEHVSNHASRHGMVITDPTVDVAQQPFLLFDRDVAL